MPVIQLTNNYPKEVLSILNQYIPERFELRMLSNNDYRSLEACIGDADYLLASGRIRIDAPLLSKAKKLKMIQRTGVGLDSLDLKAVSENGIPLYVNKAINAESVAENTLLLILASLRKLTIIDRNTKKGIWNKQKQGITTHELKGKTIGIIGMGSIGKRLVELLKPFETTILYYDVQKVSKEWEIENGLEYTDLKTLLQKSDVITLHCSLTEDTYHLINAATLAYVKPDSILINTARGGLIKTDDLTDALQSGRLAFAGIDVYETEPVPPSETLLNLQTTITTPHVSGITYESFNEMMRAAINNIILFEKGYYSEIEAFRYI